MKLTSVILSIILIFTSLVPCTDDANCVDSKHAETEQNHKKDVCSPFCICACCGCFGFLHQITCPKIPKFELKISKSNFPEIKSIFPVQLFSIWQPPKIS